MKKNRREKQLYYGMAILISLFIIVGLTKAIKGEKTVETSGQEVNKSKTQKEEQTASGDEKEKKEEKQNPSIRVLIMTNGYKNTVHSKVTISAESGMEIIAGEKTESCKEGKKITIKPDDKRFQSGNIRIKAQKGKVTVNSLKRGDGCPAYEGVLELCTTAEGIVIINELPVESYLCGVVPSEMPASYEIEALKAQAVCARSYAYRQMENYAYPEYEAHVNDSTDYQVYNNSKQAKSSSKAVKETMGETVRYKGKVATTYYYSTSCGRTTNVEAWGTKPGKKNAYLQSVEVKGENGDYEKELPWYQWEAVVPVKTLSDLIGLNTGKDVGTLSKVEVTKRGPGDIALEIKATGDKGSVTVKTENKIRKALGGSGYKIEKQDGTKTDSRELLPSAFFTIEKSGDAFVIKGGGFGHGIGMSQTGANEMAKQGKNYKEILTLFYRGVNVE